MTKVARRASEAEVLAVPHVPFTDTWHPVHHSLLLDVLDDAVHEVGLEVKEKKFSISQNGKDLFTSWILGNNGEDKGRRWMIGARNSMQMSFAVGVCAGLFVCVCSNMSFAGEFVEFRKHTSGLDREELVIIAASAVQTITTKLPQFMDWHNGLKEVLLPNQHFEILTFRAMREGVLPPSQFHQFLTHYDEERKVNDSPGTLYDFHGAATRSMREASLFRINNRNQALNKIVRNYRPQSIVPMSQWRTVGS